MGQDLITVLTNLWMGFLNTIPNFIMAILVLFIGWLVAKLIAAFVKKILAKSGIDKAAERLNDIDLIYKSNIKIVPSLFISKLLYYILMLMFIITAAEILNMPAVTNVIHDIIDYIPNLISALVVLLFGLLIADFIKDIVAAASKSLNIPAGNILANFIFWFIFLSVGMSALSQAKIDTGFITSNLSIVLGGVVAAFAIGYGFASRDLVANFIASFYHKDKVQIGDVVRVAGAKGRVIDMDSSSVTLRAEDRTIMIPLSKLTTEKVEIFYDEE